MGRSTRASATRAPRILPSDDDLRRAADVLNAGERVAMLVGQGSLGAADEVAEVADLLGAGVAKALLGKAVVGDDLPFVTGPIGLLGTRASDEMMAGCDTLLMVGTSFPYSEFLPEEGKARGIQIDVDGRMIGIRYPVEVQFVGDAKATLRALIPLLERKEDRSWRKEIERSAWEEALRSERPVVYEAVTDPEVVLFPHITLEQVRAMWSAFVHGGWEERRVLTEAVRDRARELLPGR